MTRPTDDPTPQAEELDRYRVQINYKSGLIMVIECDEFVVKRRGERISGYEWEGAVPIPMDMGVDCIESVWQLP